MLRLYYPQDADEYQQLKRFDVCRFEVPFNPESPVCPHGQKGDFLRVQEPVWVNPESTINIYEWDYPDQAATLAACALVHGGTWTRRPSCYMDKKWTRLLFYIDSVVHCPSSQYGGELDRYSLRLVKAEFIQEILNAEQPDCE